MNVPLEKDTYVVTTSQAARDEFYPYYVRYWKEASPSPHPLGSLSRRDFDAFTGPGMLLMVGSPSEIVDKVLRQHELFGHDRFLAGLDIGAHPFAEGAKAIELPALEVAPQVRRRFMRRQVDTGGSSLERSIP